MVCDDLFFARYSRDSPAAHSLAEGGASLEAAASALITAMFGDAVTEEQKSHMVEELLDVRLLDGVDGEGVTFSKDRLDER